MVRWRLFLALAVLLLLPTIISSKSKNDDDDDDRVNKEEFKLSKIPKSKYQPSRRNEDNEDEDEDEDEEEEEDGEKDMPSGGGIGSERGTLDIGRRAGVAMASPKTLDVMITRTPKKRPLECYVCAFKAETPLRACLDPTKFRVHTITCHSVDDKCFTSVISKGESYEAVVRGCRSGCIGSAETTCCELNRCNNQAFAMPVVAQPKVALKKEPQKNKAYICFPPTVVFFITILLVLQTVARVSIA